MHIGPRARRRRHSKASARLAKVCRQIASKFDLSAVSNFLERCGRHPNAVDEIARQNQRQIHIPRLNAAARRRMAELSERTMDLTTAAKIRSAISFAVYLDTLLASRSDLVPVSDSVEFQNVRQNCVGDLAVVCLFETWEAAGLSIHLDAGMPSVADARAIAAQGLKQFQALLHGCDTDLSPIHYLLPSDPFVAYSYANAPGPGQLWRLFLNIWFRDFAWHKFSQVGGPIRLSIADEDALIDQLAAILWQNRHLDVEGSGGSNHEAQ